MPHPPPTLQTPETHIHPDIFFLSPLFTFNFQFWVTRGVSTEDFFFPCDFLLTQKMSFRQTSALRSRNGSRKSDATDGTPTHRASANHIPSTPESQDSAGSIDLITSSCLPVYSSPPNEEHLSACDHYLKHNGRLNNNVFCQGVEGTGEVRIRSVAEMLTAESIMRKAGKWDEDEGKYFTKERQLQSKMSYFQGLHQSLKFSPSEEYTRRQTEITDGKLVVPRGDRAAGERKRKVNFGTAGTDLRTASTVVDGTTLTRRQLNELRRTHPLLRNSPVVEVTKTMQINTAPLLIFDDGVDVAAPPYTTNATDTRKQEAPEASPSVDGDVVAESVRASDAQKAQPELPKISAGGADGSYSSLMMQLKRTKQQVVDHGKALDTVKTLLELDGSTQLRKTITRIFANPKDAEAISEAEYQKRQDQYSADRARVQEQQQEELKDQRIELEREIGHLLTATATADGKEIEPGI